jgi:sialic acid synthase SpsE
MIILEFGSGDTCKNDKNQIKDMINQLAKYDLQRKCIIKWQLFTNLSHVEALTFDNFDFAYKLAADLGFKTTASIFDNVSLDFLLKYKIPFLKIACQTQKYDFRKDMNSFINYVPIEIPIIISVEESCVIKAIKEKYSQHKIDYLCCVPMYPALFKQYAESFIIEELLKGISDHTIDHSIYNYYKPEIYEVHYILPYQTSLDKQWSIYPNEIVNYL